MDAGLRLGVLRTIGTVEPPSPTSIETSGTTGQARSYLTSRQRPAGWIAKECALARSVPDAREIGDTLAKRGVSLSLGGQIYDPDDPMGKLFFNILATFAEFEVDLIRMRTREGMAVARAQGKLKGHQPKLSAMQQRELKRMHQTGEYRRSR